MNFLVINISKSKKPNKSKKYLKKYINKNNKLLNTCIEASTMIVVESTTKYFIQNIHNI